MAKPPIVSQDRFFHGMSAAGNSDRRWPCDGIMSVEVKRTIIAKCEHAASLFRGDQRDAVQIKCDRVFLITLSEAI